MLVAEFRTMLYTLSGSNLHNVNLVVPAEDNRKPEQTMNWKDYIHTDPGVLVGKPVVKGTRLAVDFVLGLFAEGWTERQILENYPTLTQQSLRAVFAFSAECMRDEMVSAIASSENR